MENSIFVAMVTEDFVPDYTSDTDTPTPIYHNFYRDSLVETDVNNEVRNTLYLRTCLACGMATSRSSCNYHMTICQFCSESHDCTGWKADSSAPMAPVTPTRVIGPVPNSDTHTQAYQQYRDLYNEEFFQELSISGVLSIMSGYGLTLEQQLTVVLRTTPLITHYSL